MSTRKPTQNRVIFYFMIAIGVLNILIGAYYGLGGKPFEDYFFALFIGVTLAGTSVIYLKKPNQNTDDEPKSDAL